ncbi:MAG: bifunctional demethylmenaquinone methyltransferase/2-methoxy-6-polyprenyl-1,4-benzoquinol methylase UbiE [Flavobacteriales bacterium]|nr:bifunctional demethylmenaquinone methyltransferase/2-methoxy-6-polyprenyl-1,4-benzoquinol methylase UbiE [Flavobacteriales bacterium]
MASVETKKVQVEQMFDSISPRYDLLNRTLSMGIDTIWRKRTIESLRNLHPKIILDVATGTGDLAIEALKLDPEKIIGIDLSDGMLEVGKEKLRKNNINNIYLEKGDAESLRFDENTFDAVTVAFGIRNFENLKKGLKEMLRVLKPEGRIAILEFSNPGKFPVKQVYNFYFRKILPQMGKLVSKNTKAYTYLPDSVKAFPEGEALIEIMKEAGYNKVKQHRYLFGVCTLYTAEK